MQGSQVVGRTHSALGRHNASAVRHLQRSAQLQVRRAAPAAARRLASLVHVLVHKDGAMRARMHLHAQLQHSAWTCLHIATH